MSELLAGVARANITPPVGIPMVGFAGRGPAEGVHDDLFATVLALKSEDKAAIVVALDLIFAPERLTADVTAEVGRRVGATPALVLLCASHTHYGPAIESDDTSSDVYAYGLALKHQIAGAVQVALSRLSPVRVGFGEGESHIGINRRERRSDGSIWLGRNPDGACDRSVRIARLDSDAGPLAAIVNFACHGVSAGGQMRQISADFVGQMRRLVEPFTGATCLFLQGACGNINASEMRHSFEPARKLGVMLGGEVAKVFEGIDTEPASGLATASTIAKLPAMAFSSVEEADAQVAALEGELRRVRESGADGGSVWWAEHRLARAEAMRESLVTGSPLPPVGAEVNALRFADVALVTAPGEVFTEIGMAVKAESPLPKTCFVGYSNGSIGYVPVPEAYEEGGYEVTHASRVGPGAAELLKSACLQVLRQVAGS